MRRKHRARGARSAEEKRHDRVTEYRDFVRFRTVERSGIGGDQRGREGSAQAPETDRRGYPVTGRIDIRSAAGMDRAAPSSSWLHGAESLFWLFQGSIWISYFGIRGAIAAYNGTFFEVIEWRVLVPVAGFVLTLLLRPVLDRIAQLRAPWPVLLAILSSLGASVVFTVLDLQIFSLFYPERTAQEGGVRIVTYLFWTHLHSYIFIAWTVLYFLIGYHVQLGQQTEQVLKAKALAHQAQLKMLRYQINPHFLFNTLNAMRTLVLDKRERDAATMIVSLSQFLRYTLEKDPGDMVPLSQEMWAQELYLAIEKVRFGERLSVRVDADEEALTCLVPSLILQPLVENAIKYAIAPSETGGEITVKATLSGGTLIIIVSDTGPGLPEPIYQHLTRTGVGLANIQNRLREIYEARARLILKNRKPSGLHIEIRLPVERAGGVKKQTKDKDDAYPDRR